MVNGLTGKQKKFCRGLAEGKGTIEAYRDAGYSTSGNSVGVNANAKNLKKQDKIQKELARLQALAEKGAILKREQRQALLTEIAMGDANDMPDRLRAVDQLNRMSGDYTDVVRTSAEVKVHMSLDEKLAAIEAALGNEAS